MPTEVHISQTVWDRVAASQEFKDLMATKKIFIIPAFLFFLVYYFLLPVLVGYAPQFMSIKVMGRCQSRLSVCSVPVLHGVDHCRPVRQGWRTISIVFPGTSSQKYSTRIAPKEPTSPCLPHCLMFLLFIAITLGITYWASKRSSGASAYFAAGRQIKSWQNGVAVAGDYMSAASFLGIAGIIAFQGYDGFMFSVGWLVAYLTVLLLIAEPLRNAGKYTMADVLAYRMKPRPVRAMASLSTLTVSTFYMIAQMVGAGALVALLLKGSGIATTRPSLASDLLMIIYVVFGGMLATTWVQIIKAILLMAGTLLLSILVMSHFHFSFAEFFGAIAHVTYHDKGQEVVKDFLQPGLRYKPPYGPLDLDFPWPRPDLRHRRSAAHPGPLLHRARRQNCSAQCRLGHGCSSAPFTS